MAVGCLYSFTNNCANAAWRRLLILRQAQDEERQAQDEERQAQDEERQAQDEE